MATSRHQGTGEPGGQGRKQTPVIRLDFRRLEGRAKLQCNVFLYTIPPPLLDVSRTATHREAFNVEHGRVVMKLYVRLWYLMDTRITEHCRQAVLDILDRHNARQSGSRA